MADEADLENGNQPETYTNIRKTKTDREGVVNAWNCKIPKFVKGDMKHKLEAMTNFTERFPKYMGPYIKESFPIMKKLLQTYDIKIVLNSEQESLSVSTTESTWDPYAILLARDFIRLICRNLSIEKAERVFDEGITSEIVKIKNMVSDKDIFKKRRQRLMGQGDQTLSMVENLLDVTMKVQGGTVAIIGKHQSVDQAMKFVKNVMKNTHPLYLLKKLDIYCSLKDNQNLATADWSKLLPDNAPLKPNKKKKTKKTKKEYTHLPPTPLESNLDKKLVDGEYFVSDKLKKLQGKSEQKKKSIKIQAEKRAKQYVAPVEPVTKKRKRDEKVTSELDVANLKKKVKVQKEKLSNQVLPQETIIRKKEKKEKSKDKTKKKSKKEE